MCPSPISSNQIKPCDREKIILKRRKEKCLTPLDKCQKKKKANLNKLKFLTSTQNEKEPLSTCEK